MKTFVLLVLSVLLSVCVWGQDVDAAKLNALFDHIEQYNQGIGEIAIDKDGQTVYQRRFGPKDLIRQYPSGDLPLNYRIGSITKMCTAIMIYQLHERGELELTESLADYYPDVPNARNITINHLLSHTSGLKDYAVKQDSLISWLCEPVGEKEIFEEITRQGYLFEPGDSLRYSNTGYYLLTRMLEKKYNQPYPEIIREQIVAPLGLRYTVSGLDKNPLTTPSYRLTTNREWEEAADFYFPNVIGLGDIASTPSDLVEIIKALFNRQLLSSRSVDDMKPVDTDVFGKGLMRFPVSGKVYYGHGGDTFGTSSLVVYQPEEKIAIALSINGKGITRNELWKYVTDIIYGKEYALPGYPEPNAFRLDPDDYDVYEGIYRTETPPISFKIFRENANLMIQVTGQPTLVLEALTDRKFINSTAKCELNFNLEKGKIHFIQFGHELEFSK